MPKTIMHADLDAFFASCEEAANQAYIGRPVVVGADPKGGRGRGVVSTCNYIARKFGIHSAMPISKAFRKCPKAVFIMPNFELYASVSERVMAILSKYSGKFEQVSIDEACLDVTGSPDTRYIAEKIKAEIFERENITCSIGIGSNKMVAKIASEFNKPAGLTLVKNGEEKEFLAGLGVRAIPGIGPKSGEILSRYGISKIGQLSALGPVRLAEIFGKWGIELYNYSIGIGDDEVYAHEGIKSISRNFTFESNTSDYAFISKTVEQMCIDAHNSLLENSCLAKTIGIRIRFGDFSTFTREKSISSHTSTFFIIKKTAHSLIREFESDKRKVRLVGIRLSGLKNAAGQKTFDDY